MRVVKGHKNIVMKAGSNMTVLDKSNTNHGIALPIIGMTHAERKRWWQEARFGMFIHWGLYAIPAFGEWVMHERGVTIAEYAELAAVFNPNHYDPRAWARLAREAGMRYMVLTTKHHDGFALFDTGHSDFNAVNSGAKRDLLREYADACRAEGLGVGFYFSIADWHHPNCPLLGYNGEKLRQLEPHARNPDPALFAEYMKGQLTELLTNYGTVDILWFDGRMENLYPFGKSLESMIRKLQPDILINNRLGPDSTGDFQTPEQIIPDKPLLAPDGKPALMEICDTLTGTTWGYDRYRGGNRRSPGEIIKRLVSAASIGGNYLLNIGPRPDGSIEPVEVDLLKDIGRWMRDNGESIYGAEACVPFQCSNGRVTRKGNKLYLHVFDWPENGKLNLPDVTGKLLSAKILNGDAVRISSGTAMLPERSPDPLVSVVALEYDRTPTCAPKKEKLRVEKPAVGYSVARMRPVVVNGVPEKEVWDHVQALRLTPQTHYDEAQFSGTEHFAATLKAMHAGDILYFLAEIETDEIYPSPDPACFWLNDCGRFLIGAGQKRMEMDPFAHLRETFEISIMAFGKAVMPYEQNFPGTVFRHAVERTEKGYTIMLAVPLRIMLKDDTDEDSYIRAGDTFRFNFIATQGAPSIISDQPADPETPWWERPPERRWNGVRHWLYLKGKNQNAFNVVAEWDLWRIGH